MHPKTRLVYSTEIGQTCPDCQAAITNCQCHDPNRILGTGQVKVSLDTKGRKGKGVTLIQELAMTASELQQTAKKLKNKCGSGGSVKNNAIEIQGDHRQTVLTWLQENNIKVKK